MDQSLTSRAAVPDPRPTGSSARAHRRLAPWLGATGLFWITAYSLWLWLRRLQGGMQDPLPPSVICTLWESGSLMIGLLVTTPSTTSAIGNPTFAVVQARKRFWCSAATS